MHRQASRNLGPTSNFPGIAEKEAGAKLHLGSICILLAAWDQAEALRDAEQGKQSTFEED